MTFLSLSQEERSAVFARGAEVTGRSPRLLEKDFWVCWALDRLFAAADLPQLTFKGGTALSKIYAAIDRFSEDVDITVDRTTLGYTNDYPSKSKREKALQELDQALLDLARTTVLPLFQGSSVAGLRAELAGEVVVIVYPTVLEAAPGYVTDAVRVELGARNPTEPSEQRTITADVAEHFPQLSFPRPTVRALAPIRTFYEKATILHAYACAGEPIGERKSRHHYDLVKLFRHPVIGPAALADVGMLERVAADKQELFRSSKARYDLARPGSLRLVPGTEQLESLRLDYGLMEKDGMFYQEPPTINRLVEELRTLEDLINTVATVTQARPHDADPKSTIKCEGGL